MPTLTEMEGSPAFKFADNPTINCEQFRKVAQSAYDAADLTDRHYADFVAAFGCDSISDKGSRVQGTALQTMRGAGHQHFIKFMRKLVKSTKPEHLRTSLFEPWQYVDYGAESTLGSVGRPSLCLALV